MKLKYFKIFGCKILFTVRSSCLGAGEEHRCQSESVRTPTSAPWFGRELHWSSTKAPHSYWQRVQIGFPIYSCSTLHLHHVQTSGFNLLEGTITNHLWHLIFNQKRNDYSPEYPAPHC